MMSAINDAGVFRFLKKPWEPEEVIAAVEQAVEHVAQQRTIQQLVGLLARRSDELSRSLSDLQESQQRLLHLERLGTMGQLAAGITHDVRNVMVSLRAVEWEIKESTSTPPELLETVQVGLGGLDNLVRTLDALHSFARGGEKALNLRKVSPGSVVQDAIAIARMDRNFRMRQVDVCIDERLPKVDADPQKLTQVLVNLVRNALHATRERDHIRVEARGGDRGVMLVVEDSGPGIAPDVREKLFEPFTSSKGEGGMGMGLYMARLIVESHHGSISVASGERGGARFQVLLPAAQA
jgi:signal transduction histidine kinase